MLEYSVAIRTLGTNPEMLRTELQSVFAQTVRPAKVVVYIAKGYKTPDFRIADEMYVHVRKGMLTQRALEYREIDTPLILLLDDDVYLAPDSVEKLIAALENGNYDCVAPDTFANHKLSAMGKLYCFFSNLTLPMRNSRYAFKVHYNGTLSFLDNPHDGVYDSQSASGPCSLWRKQAFLDIDVADECWIDSLDFSYAEDQLYYYKLYANGGRLGMYYGSGVEHRDGRASRNATFKGPRTFFTRAKAQYIIWHRSIFKPDSSAWRRSLKAGALFFKLLWLLPVHCVAAITYRSPKVPYYFITGTIAGIRHTHSRPYLSLPPYIK